MLVAVHAVGRMKAGPEQELAARYLDRFAKGGPAGGGFSTAPDLVKFHQALRTYKLLDKKHTELVTTGKVDMPGGKSRYGYGFGDNNPGGKHIIGHSGGAPGIAANLDMFPELGYTAVALMNSDTADLTPVVKGIRERIPAK